MPVHRRPAGGSRPEVDSASRCPAITERGSLGGIGRQGGVSEPGAARALPSAVTPTVTEATEKGPALLPGEQSTGLW